MKSYSKDTIKGATTDQLKVWKASLDEKIAKGNITWKNSKGELVQCPWNVFNASGAIVVTRTEDELNWDLGTRVQIRAEAEKRNSGNIIASFKSTLQAKQGTLTASVRTKGLERSKCPVIDQLAEAESVLGNQQRVNTELLMRTQEDIQREEKKAERDAMDSIPAEQKAVALQLKEAEEAAKAAKAAKVKPVVKDAKPEIVTVPVPVAAANAA